MKPKIIIHIEGGVVQGVHTDLDSADIRVIDLDELRETHTREERDTYLHNGVSELNEIDFALN